MNSRGSKLRCHRTGFTLVEATVSIVIVGTMLVAAMNVAGRSAVTRFEQKESARTQALARELLAEIVQQPYEQPGVTTAVLGSETGESRPTFNDVDDYNGLTESPPVDLAGTPIPGFAGWIRSVKVEWVTPSLPANGFIVSNSETGLKRITVTVLAPSGKSATAVALRSRQGMYDKSHGAATSYTNWIGVNLRIGTDATTTAASGVNPLNQVP